MGYNEKIRGKPSEVKEPDLAGSYTGGDYLSWSYDFLMELIGGKIFKMSPAPSSDHQRIFRNIFVRAGAILEGHSCQLWAAPFDVYLVKEGEDHRQARNIVQPDICVICDPSKIRSFGCVGAPDFIIEILSPSTRQKDMTLKRELYAEYGVEEYWMVSPAERMILVNTLEANGTYRTHPPAVEGMKLSPQRFPQWVMAVEEVFKGVEERG